MELITWELTGKSVSEMTTEIRFFIANCKVQGIDIFKLNIKKVYNGEREEKRFSSINRILYAVKRAGLIQLYINFSELNGNSTEAAYINNKYPSLVDNCKETEGFLIKL